MAKIPAVFVIDQDQDVRYQVQRLVQGAGFSLSGQAGLGTEAVALAKETRPDILLCGVREPLSRALQTVESLLHVLPQTPVIVYSEAADLETVRRVMLAGARDFLQAPFKPDELRRSLTATLESEERRRLREAGNGMLGPEAVVLTVFGAKGGVGKTAIATNLAVAFARAGQTTVLVDADDTFGDAAPSLAMPTDYAVTDMLRELAGSGDDISSKPLTHHDSGLAVLPAPANPFAWKEIPGQRLQRLIQQLGRRFDVVVLDTGSTLSDVTLAALQSASLILWVTTPEYASVRDSLQALQAIQGMKLADDRIRIVLNAVSPELEIRPASVEEVLSTKIFWTIPYDRILRQSTQLGKAVIDANPRSPAARNLIDLARVLTGGPIEPQENGTRRWFLGAITRGLRTERRERE